MKYTEEIFNILSKGGFISANSVSPAIKRYYDAIEEDLTDYYEYYKGIGFYLEGGDGYYMFTRQEAKVDLERKLEAVMKWIDYLSFLKTYDATFGPGFKFRPADIEVQISCQMELKDKASKLFQDKKKYNEVVEKLVSELEKAGMIELENEQDNIFLKNILGSFIAVYAEYNNSENKEVICNWSRDCRISLLQDNNEDKQRIQHLREKYHSLNKELIYNVLNPEYVTAIIQYIITGAPLVEFIVTEIRDKQKGLKPWKMLSGFFDMEQQKLESICQDTITSILDREIKDAYQLGYSIAYLSYFHAIGIFYFIQAYVSLIKVRIAEMIDIQTSLEELYQLRGLFISGCNYVTTDSKTSITDDIVDYFLQKMKSKINELPDQMQKALRNLTEGTVEQLIIIDRLPYPDKSCTYELRAIFASEDANALFDAICKLSNKSKNTFTQFLAYHYNFDYDLQDVGNRYKADVPCLLKLKDLVGNEISISKGVDKLAFIRLKDALIEAIRRCEGKNDTLPPM